VAGYSTVLEELDRVDWARLGHAYGPAVDVPDQIRALRSPEADVRRKARGKLYGNIFHQGTRYEATAYAVPFLLEILAAADSADRSDLIGLLTAVAVGYDESWLPDGLPIAEHRRAAVGGDILLAAAPHPGDDDFDEDEGDFRYIESLSGQEQDQLFAHVAVTAYDAVRAGVPLFRALLTDSDLVVRTMAAYALAWFPEDAADSLRALAAVAASSSDPIDAVVSATALVAIGLLGGQPAGAGLDDSRPLVRWGAAIALARIDGSSAGRAVVDELLVWAGGDTDRDSRIPFLDGDLAGYAGLALGQVGVQHADAAFDALLARIPSVSGMEALPIVGEALRVAFPAGRLPDHTPFTALDDRQRRLIHTLAQSPATWRINDAIFANFSSLIHSYGLPPSNDALQRYAGTNP